MICRVADSISSAMDTAPLEISSTAVLISSAVVEDCDAMDSRESPFTIKVLVFCLMLPIISCNLSRRDWTARPITPSSSFLFNILSLTCRFRLPSARDNRISSDCTITFANALAMRIHTIWATIRINMAMPRIIIVLLLISAAASVAGCPANTIPTHLPLALNAGI